MVLKRKVMTPSMAPNLSVYLLMELRIDCGTKSEWSAAQVCRLLRASTQFGSVKGGSGADTLSYQLKQITTSNRRENLFTHVSGGQRILPGEIIVTLKVSFYYCAVRIMIELRWDYLIINIKRSRSLIHVATVLCKRPVATGIWGFTNCLPQIPPSPPIDIIW